MVVCVVGYFILGIVWVVLICIVSVMFGCVIGG